MSVSVQELISMTSVKGWFTQTENEGQGDFLQYLLTNRRIDLGKTYSRFRFRSV